MRTVPRTDHPVQVFVKFPTGKTLQVETDRQKTCYDLKVNISAAALVDAKQPPITPEQQILLFSGQQLEDSRLQSDYNIQHDSTLHVSIKPHSKDLLDFDRCDFCALQAFDPCVLPCGHSCCRYCIPHEATECPVPDCASPSFHGRTRDSFPANWLASHFCDPKPETTHSCQVCAEKEIQTEATRWCETCFGSYDIVFYCDACDASEHSTRFGRSHVRVPLDQMTSIPPPSTCQPHKRPLISFCLDDLMFMCSKCHAEHHRGHKTRFIDEYQMKNDLMTLVSSFPDAYLWEKEEPVLQKLQQRKQEELKIYDQRIKYTKQEIQLIESKLKSIHENSEKSQSAAVILMKSIEQYPTRDFYDQNKFELMTSRVKQTKNLLAKHVSSRPQVKQAYTFKFKFGTEQNRFYGAAIDTLGNIFFSSNHCIHVYQSDGLFMRSFGAYGSCYQYGFFNNPTALAFTPDGQLAVLDSGNTRIQLLMHLINTKVALENPSFPSLPRVLPLIDLEIPMFQYPKLNLVLLKTKFLFLVLMELPNTKLEK